MRIAGWLKNQNKIDDAQYNKSFWNGIPKKLRPKFEAVILRKNANHNMKDPFTTAQIIVAAEEMFGRSRFDADGSSSEDSDDSDSHSSEEDDSDSDSKPDSSSDSEKSSSESESDKSKHRSKPRHKKDNKKSRQHKESKSRKARRMAEAIAKLEAEGKKAQEDDEIEVLIKRLQGMSLDDPNYAVIFYRAYKLDNDIARIIRAPMEIQAKPTNQLSNNGQRYGNAGNAAPMTDPSCYGCGNKGHRMGDCEKLRGMITDGRLKRDDNGRVIMSDGRLIQRNRGESIVEAALKMAAPVANFKASDSTVNALALSGISSTGASVNRFFRVSKAFCSECSHRHGVS